MRQPQRNNNNNRSRGRGRKSPNPMSKSYESNGPDVKIRGNASTIAEKYTTLGRDAQSSGDRVMAENYLQHAEHYNRLVAAAAAQQEEKRAQEAQQREARAAENNGDEVDGNEPQPNVEVSNGSGDAVEEGQERPRSNGRGRNQRNRRPKNSEKAAAETNGNDGADEKSADENISADAAALPDSILGMTDKAEAVTADE